LRIAMLNRRLQTESTAPPKTTVQSDVVLSHGLAIHVMAVFGFGFSHIATIRSARPGDMRSYALSASGEVKARKRLW
ncbi:MAG: hypothetical protein MZV70_13925, partial [Desulfobacterales bacterium]|nr:hypothetical protein [Desulfobacterales bacterium]